MQFNLIKHFGDEIIEAIHTIFGKKYLYCFSEQERAMFSQGFDEYNLRPMVSRSERTLGDHHIDRDLHDGKWYHDQQLEVHRRGVHRAPYFLQHQQQPHQLWSSETDIEQGCHSRSRAHQDENNRENKVRGDEKEFRGNITLKLAHLKFLSFSFVNSARFKPIWRNVACKGQL